MNQLQLDIQPGARRRDPVTSHAAASSAKELQAQHHQVILGCLKIFGPQSKDAIAAHTKLDPVQICRRLPELQRLGLAHPTGRTCLSLSGRAEREWSV